MAKYAPLIPEAFECIDEAFEAESISEATYQCLADYLAYCDPMEQEEDTTDDIDEFCEMIPEGLAAHRRQEVTEWQEDTTPEEWSERFNVGQGMEYESIDALIDSTDFQYVLEILRRYCLNKIN